MTAGGWSALQREARAARRAGAPATSEATANATATSSATASSSMSTTSTLRGPVAAEIDPAAIAARLAAVRPVSERLHARLAALDPAQQAAVLADDDTVLVRAQVGSGKTTVLIHRALYLHVVGGVPLERIALLTFTTRAADELRARLDEVLGRATSPAERWLVGTFHAVAAALLRRALPADGLGHRRDFTVLDEDAMAALIDDVARAHRLRVGRRRNLRERLRGLAATSDGDGELVRLAALVRDAKRAANAMDFDDLIDHALALLAAPAVARPRWILVDELQDCEPRELALVQRLRGPATGVFAVGDPLQAIYGWRGSAADGFTRFAGGVGGVVHELPASYRSTRTILDGARAVLGAQPVALGTLVAVRPPGAPIVVRRHRDAAAEADDLAARLTALVAAGVRADDIAVLGRLRAQIDALAEALTARGVPCDVDDDRALGDSDVERTPQAREAVRVLTLHAAKGLELRHVFIAGANLGIVPLAIGERIDDEAEERRLLFVGLTRARDTVEVSYVANPERFGALGAPSPLLHQVPASLIEWHDAADAAIAASLPPRPPAIAVIAAATPSPAPTTTTAQPSPPPAPAAAAASTVEPWRAGQAVRHPRYGAGVVVRLAGDTVECDFGKLGPRAFPLRLCPLTATAGAPP